MQLAEMRDELRKMGLIHEKASIQGNEQLLVHLCRLIVSESRQRWKREEEILTLLRAQPSTVTTNLSDIEVTLSPAVGAILQED